MNKLKQLLADKPVNTGRQWELDLSKALIILCLPVIHCIIECCTDEMLESGIPYLFDTIIGGPFSAPMYMLAMGISMHFSRKKEPLQIAKRGLKVILVFYVHNICRFLIPYLIGYAISKDREQFIEPLLYRVLGNDILMFGGLALLVMALFIHLKLSPWIMLLIAAGCSLLGMVTTGVDTKVPLLNIFLGYFIGTEDETGLLISDFPLLIWLIAPVSGYVFGSILLRVSKAAKSKFYQMVSLPALGIAAIYFAFGIYYKAGMFGEGQNCYYHMMPWDMAASIILNIGMVGLWFFISEILPTKPTMYLSDISSKITSFYCIHWVFVRVITNVILYIKNGTQVLPLGYTLLLSVGIMLVTLLLAEVWRVMKIRRVDIKNR